MPDPLIPVSRRVGFLYLEHTRLDLGDGVPICESAEGATPIPAGTLACLMLGPGTSVTHAVMSELARLGCLILWVGEHGVRVYSAGKPGGAFGRRIGEQAGLINHPSDRLEAARRLYRIMLDDDAPSTRSIDQLRGLEGSWVRAKYTRLAQIHGVIWVGRDSKKADPINRSISMATSTLYGVTEAAILSLGLSPALGIVHSGDSRSLVFDIADTVKFRTVVPLAFRLVAENPGLKDLGLVRRGCRDLFVRNRLLERMVTIIEHVVFGHELGCDLHFKP